MEFEQIRHFFGWCAIINMGILLYWFLFLAFAHNWVYRMHVWWFDMSKEKFISVHYTGMLLFKLSIFAFNITPYLALRIIA